MTQIQVLRTQNADLDVPLPSYETAQAAGMDLRANLPLEQRVEGITLAPNGRALVPTGLAIALPHGIEAQIRPRSGLALHHGITLLNSPGTIDADYRGELGVILLNTSIEPFTVRHGDRIAQMVLAPVVQADWHPVADLPLSPRGDGGFGSTGR